MWAAPSAEVGVRTAAARTGYRHAHRKADQIVGIAFLLSVVATEADVALGRLDHITAAATAEETAHHGGLSAVVEALSNTAFAAAAAVANVPRLSSSRSSASKPSLPRGRTNPMHVCPSWTYMSDVLVRTGIGAPRGCDLPAGALMQSW